MTTLLDFPYLARRVSVEGSGCWLWTGAPNGYGYGRVMFGGERWLVHRLSHALTRNRERVRHRRREYMRARARAATK